MEKREKKVKNALRNAQSMLQEGPLFSGGGEGRERYWWKDTGEIRVRIREKFGSKPFLHQEHVVNTASTAIVQWPIRLPDLEKRGVNSPLFTMRMNLDNFD